MNRRELGMVLAALEGVDRALEEAERDPEVLSSVVEGRTILLGAMARLDAYIADLPIGDRANEPMSSAAERAVKAADHAQGVPSQAPHRQTGDPV